MRYQRREKRERRSWIPALVLILVLLLRFGQSETVVSLREQLTSAWNRLDYEEAVETFGRSFAEELKKTEGLTETGRQIFGFRTDQ